MASTRRSILWLLAAGFAAASLPYPARAEEPVIPFLLERPHDVRGGPSITLTLSGTTDLTADGCGAATSFAVPPGTDVRFCYSAANTGSVTFDQHDLTDMDGVVFTDYPLILEPGFVMYLMQNRQPLADGTNVATWTATNSTTNEEASDSASVPIEITDPIFYCNGPATTFTSGIPVGWTSYDHFALADFPDSAVDWETLLECGESENYTGGRGDVACASSALAGEQAYDTQLRSHSFSLLGATSARVEFLVNYQDAAAGGDALSVDVSIDGGDNWTPLATSTDVDYGGFRTVSGALVTIDLASVLGETDVRLGWRYVNHSSTAHDEYVQIDNIRLACDNGIFFDGFESSDGDAWSSVSAG